MMRSQGISMNLHPSDGDPSTTLELFQQYVLPTYGRFPLCLGEGCRVWDEAGREYLDFGAGIAVCSLGHAHPRLSKAMAEQSIILGHTSNLYYTRPQGLLAKRITDMIGQPGRCFFCNSGAEANEALYKLARRFGNMTAPGNRHEIVTFLQSFHGRTLAGIAATGQEKVRKGFEPLTPGFVHATFNDLASVERVVGDNTCAILLEPIQGESGILPAEAGFLRGLRRLCDERNRLLMFDEVQCGFGRTGDWCGWRSLGAPGVEPDAVSWAKGMAGSFPIGAMWARDREVDFTDGTKGRLGDLLGPGSHGTTFGGNPLGCVAALETMRIIEDENLVAHAREIGARAKAALAALDSPLIEAVRGVGLMLGIVLREDAIKARPTFREAGGTPAFQFTEALQGAGLIVVPSGTHVIRWLPPLNVTWTEIEQALAILNDVLAHW